VAGLGFFLLGMSHVEGSLKLLAGRPFKRFLRDYTKNPLMGVGIGVVMTAILQSSGVVTLMLMAFAGAGVLELRNALGIVLGSNLGTTLKGWVVSTLGFKVDFDDYVFPLIGIGSLIMVSIGDQRKLHQWGRFVAGFGLTFQGLSTMREGVESVAINVDLSTFAQQGPWFFLAVGFVLTTLIQSSSATMMITLSALSARMIDLQAGAALVIGADLGSTMTAMMGSYKGIPVKKRVAWAHFIFNLVTNGVCFLVMIPLLDFINLQLAIADPLYALVMFHSLMNVVGIVMFLPILNRFASFLERRFADRNGRIARYISRLSAAVPEAAIVGLEREGREYLNLVIHANQDAIGVAAAPTNILGFNPLAALNEASAPDHYETLKRLEGEILEFVARVQEQSLSPEVSERLTQIMVCVRHGMMSAKGVKDVRHNIREFQASISEEVVRLFEMILSTTNRLYEDIPQLWDLSNSQALFERITDLIRRNRETYQDQTNMIHKAVISGRVRDLDTSSLLNVNSELHQSNRVLLLAVTDLLLDAGASQHIRQMSF